VEFRRYRADEGDCADVGLIRSEGRGELLYPRSKVVTTAKAFGLQVIDIVHLVSQSRKRVELMDGTGLRELQG